LAATSLLDRAVYGISQVDRLLKLSPGTARRWIDGYERAGKAYPPIVRQKRTGNELVTWGEFVETRLLAEYRDAGVSMLRMRPAVEKLRELFNRRYPLAYAKPYLDVEGQELVRRTQEEVGLERQLLLVVVRNDQLVLTPEAQRFVHAVEFHDIEGLPDVVVRLNPDPEVPEVVVDPLRQFGEPVVRSVPVEVIAEQVRAGEVPERVATLYDLEPAQVWAAIRYELRRATTPQPAPAA